jgi:DNA-binding response OmpR family regulator
VLKERHETSQPICFLHLEDDPADAQLVESILESAGMVCQITRVQTGDAFDEALRQGEYDIILGDYRLPTFDGMSALRLSRQLASDVPFIFVSGVMGEDAAIEGLTEGATDYVLKDKLTRLEPAVKRALRDAENRQERKRAERELRTISIYARSLIEASLDPLVTISTDGKIIGNSIQK